MSDITLSTDSGCDSPAWASDMDGDSPAWTSDSGDERMVIPKSPNPYEIPLDPQGLFMDWKDPEQCKWRAKKCGSFATIGDMWSVILAYLSAFQSSLKGQEEKARLIFSKLVAECQNRRPRTNVNVSEFNELHPVWTFGKQRPGQKDPFDPIQRNSKGWATNVIDINLKKTRSITSAFSNDFREGYIPFLLLNFIGGSLPDGINAISFSQTVAVSGTHCNYGWRVRIMTETPDRNVLIGIKEYLERDFVRLDHTFRKCVVRISLPRE